MGTNTISRRSFLEKGAAITAAVALPSILTQVNANAVVKPRKIPAGEKVNVACIGIGNRGNDVIKEIAKTGMANIVVLCDVDMGAPHTQEIANMFPKAERFVDFRKMFDKASSKFDAVVICLPDHAHFAATILAMSLGKHVYVEKPLARTFNECQLLINAEKRYGVVTQMGNQGHSEANYFQFKAWKDAGIIKDVTAITAHMNSARRWHEWDPKITNFRPAQPIPSTLDWDTWIMTGVYHDYNEDYVQGQWRCWYDYGLGALGDWGAHIIDTAHQFLELGLPFEVNPLRVDQHNPYFYPMASTINFKFAARKDMPAVDLTWYDGVNNLPSVPEGYGVSALDPNIPPSNFGTVQPAKLNPGKIIYSKELTFKGGSHGSTLQIIPKEKAKEMASKLPEVPKSPSNHFANFLLACKGEEKTRSPFSVSGPLSQVLSLGVVAQQLGSKIEFNAERNQITNSTLGNLLLTGTPPRKGWEEFYKL
ncbi:MAG: Gfo/Idh/MocA family oxidoreductase [Rikenellaceae bacterium]